VHPCFACLVVRTCRARVINPSRLMRRSARIHRCVWTSPSSSPSRPAAWTSLASAKNGIAGIWWSRRSPTRNSRRCAISRR
jgi:arylsulfatase A-like enzyme